MSNKHLASLLLFAVIVGFIQLDLVMNKKMTAARDALQAAESARENAENGRRYKEISLVRQKQVTAPLRQYLARWLPKLQETNEENKARSIFARVFKQHGEGLVAHADKSSVLGNPKSPFIPQRYQNVLSVEGDFSQAVNLIGQIERQMPASRIATMSISKGTRGNDVKLSLTVDTPIMAKADAAGAAAAVKK